MKRKKFVSKVAKSISFDSNKIINFRGKGFSLPKTDKIDKLKDTISKS